MSPIERILSFVPRWTSMEGHGVDVRFEARRGVLRHLTVWIGPLLGLLFALRFANAVSGARRRGAWAFWAAGVVVVAVVVTNPIHGLYLRSPWPDNSMELGPLGWSMVAITNVAVLAVVVPLAASLARADGRHGPWRS